MEKLLLLIIAKFILLNPSSRNKPKPYSVYLGQRVTLLWGASDQNSIDRIDNNILDHRNIVVILISIDIGIKTRL